MSRDEYRAGPPRRLDRYPCGARAGDRLTLKKRLRITTHTGRPTGASFPAGSRWTVVHGVAREPHEVWLHDPSGELHTWDGASLFDAFDILARAPRAGAQAMLRDLPPWSRKLAAPSPAVFAFCVGRRFPVTEVDAQGLVVLDVSAAVDPHFGGRYNDIRVEAEWLATRPSTPPRAPGRRSRRAGPSRSARAPRRPRRG